ncbi:MAG: TonB family protein [Aliidongia sp.]
MLQYIIVFIVAISVPLSCVAAAVEPATPIDRPSPEYPASAVEASGHVKIGFTIDADGRVTEPQIQESIPPGLFDGAALDAMREWRYQPRRVDGQAAAQPGNVIVLNFTAPPPETGPTATMVNAFTPGYSHAAFEAKQEGDVTVVFDLDENGLVGDAKVSRSTLPGVFDTQALEAVKNSRFRPIMVNGVPAAVKGINLTIPFRLATAVIGLKRIDHAVLQYPPAALRDNKQGYCYVKQKIAGDGSVEKADVIATGPGDVFRQACLDFALLQKFEPPDQDKSGHIGHSHAITIKFRFNNSDTLLKPGQWAKVRYTVDTMGRAKDIEIIAVSDSYVHERDVIAAVRQHVVKPILEKGVAVEKPNQIILVTGPDQ